MSNDDKWFIAMTVCQSIAGAAGAVLGVYMAFSSHGLLP